MRTALWRMSLIYSWHGRSYELAITPGRPPHGTEEDVQLSDMPEAAQAALKAQAGDEGKLSEFGKAVDKNNKTTYEADIKKDDKKFEVAVDADGTVVSKEDILPEKEKKEINPITHPAHRRMRGPVLSMVQMTEN